ncbi:MAG: ATP-binding protein [Desulfobulbaceae bacterium]|jgi:signal transduction histidine kinase|nr:ATP-binding protein [Desulfobulbaceae bacterium]
MTEAKNGEKLDPGLRPFKLVTYFSFSSLVVILAFTLTLSWLISANARRVMLKQSEEYTLLMAENLNQQVFRRFVLPTALRYGNIALSNPEQFESLDRIIRGIISGMKIDAVTLYDSSVNIISYSTQEEKIGVKNAGDNEYRRALAGEGNSLLTYRGTMLNLLWGERPGCSLRTFLPFRQVRESGEEDGPIMGVMEINKDLSSEYRNILRLQGGIVIASALVGLILFLILLAIVSRAGRIMEERARERLRLEEKLNQAERLAHLGTMVATVSHEIKSPLGIVRSTAEILEKRIEKIAPGNERLARIIVDETVRLNDIVVSFLDFARPQQPKLALEDVGAVLATVLMFLETQLAKQHTELECRLTAGLPAIPLDKGLMHRAFLNIFVNAAQAVGEQGKITVTTKQASQDFIEITISDSGPGMDAEKLARIFKPFYTDKRKGTGLGLAITKNIIDSHHGRIEVESAEGRGTTFHLFLPARA